MICPVTDVQSIIVGQDRIFGFPKGFAICDDPFSRFVILLRVPRFC